MMKRKRKRTGNGKMRQLGLRVRQGTRFNGEGVNASWSKPSGSTARGGQPSRFATLGDFNRDNDDDDDEQGKQNFFAGGEKSYVPPPTTTHPQLSPYMLPQLLIFCKWN